MFIKTIKILVILLISSQALANDACEIAFDDAVRNAYHEALFAPNADPLQSLSQKLPDAASKKLDLFKQDVTELLELAEIVPELRNDPNVASMTLKQFAEKWELSQRTAEDVLLFWGRSYYRNLDIAGGERFAAERLSEIGRDRQLTSSQDPLVRRYVFYLANIRQLSVAELASFLGPNFTDGQVRSELNQLQISVYQTWQEPLSVFAKKNLADRELKLKRKSKSYLQAANELIENKNLSLQDAAEVLGVGREALKSIRSHQGTKNKSFTWDRLLEYKGQTYEEPNLLMKLFATGMSYKKLANTLNDAAKLSDSTDENFRTSAAVGSKISELGLSIDYNISTADKKHPRFGVLKKNGHLVAENASVYVQVEMANKSLKEIAGYLQITAPGLEDFMWRHSIIEVAEHQKTASGKKIKKIKSSYKAQRDKIKMTQVSRYLEDNGIDRLRTTFREDLPADEVMDFEVYRILSRMLHSSSRSKKVAELSEKAQVVAEEFFNRKKVVNVDPNLLVEYIKENDISNLLTAPKISMTPEETLSYRVYTLINSIYHSPNKAKRLAELPEGARLKVQRVFDQRDLDRSAILTSEEISSYLEENGIEQFVTDAKKIETAKDRLSFRVFQFLHNVSRSPNKPERLAALSTKAREEAIKFIKHQEEKRAKRAKKKK